MLGPGKLDISKWVPKSTMLGPKIDDFRYIFDRFFVDFMFNFASWPGRPDKRRTHTEHTQSTHRATFSALPVPLPRQVPLVPQNGEKT